VKAAERDLLFTPVTDLVARVRAGDLSPVDLVEASLDAIERLNPTINAFTLVLADEARAEARASAERLARGEAGPLEGLPMPIKDVVYVAGTPMTMGSRMMPEIPLSIDSAQVARLRSAGAVITGRTHMPEFGSTITSESVRFGTTRNPWNLEHIPGGSSTGAAAAVAAGMAPAAHGADGGGSLRIPAAWTGLFTMKPSRGRVSSFPEPDILWTDVYGFITRTVRDNALLLDCIDGFELGDLFWSSPKARPFLDECDREPGRLRVGVCLKPPIDVPVSDECIRPVREAAELLASLGHQVEDHELDWRDDEAQALFAGVWSGMFGYIVERLIKFGCDPELLEPHNRVLWEMSKSVSAAQYLSSLGEGFQHLQPVVDSFRTYDVVLTPVTAQPPPKVGELYEGTEDNPFALLFPNSARFVPFTSVFNLTGQPAASWPLGWAAGGLPVGVQAVGRPGDEATLFRLSAQVEAARPWADRRPDLSALQLTP